MVEGYHGSMWHVKPSPVSGENEVSIERSEQRGPALIQLFAFGMLLTVAAALDLPLLAGKEVGPAP